MTRLKMLEGYEEAELTAARVAAAKMGFYTSPAGETYNGDDNDNGTPIMDAEPGTFEVLPEGWDLNHRPSAHPCVSDFVKSTLRCCVRARGDNTFRVIVLFLYSCG
jgi:capsid protein